MSTINATTVFQALAEAEAAMKELPELRAELADAKYHATLDKQSIDNLRDANIGLRTTIDEQADEIKRLKEEVDSLTFRQLEDEEMVGKARALVDQLSALVKVPEPPKPEPVALVGVVNPSPTPQPEPMTDTAPTVWVNPPYNPPSATADHAYQPGKYANMDWRDRPEGVTVDEFVAAGGQRQPEEWQIAYDAFKGWPANSKPWFISRSTFEYCGGNKLYS